MTPLGCFDALLTGFPDAFRCALHPPYRDHPTAIDLPSSYRFDVTLPKPCSSLRKVKSRTIPAFYAVGAAPDDFFFTRGFRGI